MGDAVEVAPPPPVPANDDPLFVRLRQEALDVEQAEPELTCLLRKTVLAPDVTSFDSAVARAVSHRLALSCGSNPSIGPDALRRLFLSAASSDELELDHTTSDAWREDALATERRDPATDTLLEVVMFCKGYAALACHRTARRKWKPNRSSRFVSLWLQSQASAAFGVDIHPAATIGIGVMLDHGTGVVIGETAKLGDGCTLLHGVTLGGTGKEHGDRHPKVGRDVLIGANASVLGNITIGDGAKIGAGSIVLQPIPHGATAVGAPARIIGWAKEKKPGSTVDMRLLDVVAAEEDNDDGDEEEEEESASVPSLTMTDRSSTTDDGVYIDSGDSADPFGSFVGVGVRGKESRDDRSSLVGKAVKFVDQHDEGIEGAQNKMDANGHGRKPGGAAAGGERRKGSEGCDGPGWSPPQFSGEMCPFKHFVVKDPPPGAITFCSLRFLLMREGCTMAEVGEVFFALLRHSPHRCKKIIPPEVFRTRFAAVARKYTRLNPARCDEMAREDLQGLFAVLQRTMLRRSFSDGDAYSSYGQEGNEKVERRKTTNSSLTSEEAIASAMKVCEEAEKKDC